MGTNFYAKLIPTKERREKLKELIDKSEDYREIQNEVQEMYGQVGEYNIQETGVVHLCKRSGGWKILWNPNWYEVDEGTYDMEKKEWIPKPVIKKFYDLNPESISEFVHRKDVRIFDEYDTEYTADEFMKEMLEWDKGTWINGEPLMDGEMYRKIEESEPNYNGYYDRFKDPHADKWRRLGFDVKQHDFYSGGLRFSTSTDFS